ncbi:MAG: nuclear transport factor 2 family protein [Mailhella sp.]|nr:nuclear transport factor 2 family protein [Mailhella sp.]
MTVKDDQSAVEELVRRYVESVNSCDPEIVNEIWSHDEHVSFVAPAGQFKTYKAIRDDFILGIFAKKFAKRELKKEDLKIHLCGNMAWIEFKWCFDAVTLGGEELHNRGLETQIAQKEDGVWKLVHIHYSRI